MDKSFHYLLMVNQALFQKQVFNNLADTGLTTGQPKILDYLNKHNGSIQKDIAKGCQIDTATLTGILSRMEQKGLIIRKIKDDNRRSSYVYLTNLGFEKYKILEKVFIEMEKSVFIDIPPEDASKFMEVFLKIYFNLTNSEELQ